MVPRPPPPEARLGFVYSSPYRIQGISVAGEQAVVHVPELDVCFDVGLCPRAILPTPTIALSHTHMDHVGGLPYWFSQRFFQKMPGTARCLVHPKMAEPLRRMMAAWVDLERQRTPHEIVAIEPDTEFQLRPNVVVRAIEVSHTTPALGFVAIERRSKLRDEFHGLPQDRLRELRAQGIEITRTVEIPLVAYTGDTEPGDFLLREEFRRAQVVITECTFFEDEHRDRAKIGKHLHVEDLRPLLEAWEARDVVIVHVSRRTLLPFARTRLEEVAGKARAESIHLLMDHKANKARLEAIAAQRASAADAAQAAEAGEPAE
ncbi:MAG: MBL fold metallo-hydrolase, partial [Phycisphaerales bacterium]